MPRGAHITAGAKYCKIQLFEKILVESGGLTGRWLLDPGVACAYGFLRGNFRAHIKSPILSEIRPALAMHLAGATI